MSDRRYDEPDPVRWFSSVGVCKCGKLAHGQLMGPRNESYGPSCHMCAEKRIKKAAISRAKFYSEMEKSQ